MVAATKEYERSNMKSGYRILEIVIIEVFVKFEWKFRSRLESLSWLISFCQGFIFCLSSLLIELSLSALECNK